MLKLARAGDLINVPEPLYFKRRHAKSTSRAWFSDWPQSRKRRALIVFCVGLLDAVLPAAQSNLQRVQLLYAVLERLALHQWFYPIKLLSPNKRRDLVVDFINELRSSAEIDVAQALEIDWALLSDLSLRRFGLADAGNASTTAQATRAIEDANRCVMAKLSYRLSDDIDFSRADIRMDHLGGPLFLCLQPAELASSRKPRACRKVAPLTGVVPANSYRVLLEANGEIIWETVRDGGKRCATGTNPRPASAGASSPACGSSCRSTRNSDCELERQPS